MPENEALPAPPPSPRPPQLHPLEPVRPVVVVDVQVRFGTLVWFLVKLAIAAIPATLILAAIGAIPFVLLGLGGVFATALHRLISG